MRGVPRERLAISRAPSVDAGDAEDFRRTLDDAGKFVRRVELQTLHDAEAIAQRSGEKSGARGRADQRERRQIELDRARGRTVADHDVDLVVLHRRIQDFLDDRRQAMDFIDEQHVARLQIREQRGQIAGAFDDRARCRAHVHAEFVGDDVRERGLAESGRTENQHVIERFAATARRLDVDRHLLAHGALADVFVESLRTDFCFDGFVFARRAGVDYAVVAHDVIIAWTRDCCRGRDFWCAKSAKKRFAAREDVPQRTCPCAAAVPRYRRAFSATRPRHF